MYPLPKISQGGCWNNCITQPYILRPANSTLHSRTIPAYKDYENFRELSYRRHTELSSHARKRLTWTFSMGGACGGMGKLGREQKEIAHKPSKTSNLLCSLHTHQHTHTHIENLKLILSNICSHCTYLLYGGLFIIIKFVMYLILLLSVISYLRTIAL
jgi:hypothetical protein